MPSRRLQIRQAIRFRALMETTQRMTRLARSATVLGLLVALACLLGSPALAGDEAGSCEARKPLVVKIHADWCGSCKATEATWNRVETDLGDQATVVELDVSDRVAYTASAAEAERLGIEEFFQEYRSRTGTVAVLDCVTLEPVAVMSGERDFDKYREAVEKAGHTS
jgi:thiol-disulfide isomerase/thioredoxin